MLLFRTLGFWSFKNIKYLNLFTQNLQTFYYFSTWRNPKHSLKILYLKSFRAKNVMCFIFETPVVNGLINLFETFVLIDEQDIQLLQCIRCQVNNAWSIHFCVFVITLLHKFHPLSKIEHLNCQICLFFVIYHNCFSFFMEFVLLPLK